MQIKHVKLSVLKKHPKNARVHDEANIRAIADSLVNFGQRTPLVLNRKNHILKGNGTFDAMVLLGWKTCQITTAFNLTPEEELAYLIADNKTGDMSEFDFELASNILKDLDKKGFDLTKTGFREFESAPLLEANFNPGTPGEMPSNENGGQEGFITLKFNQKQSTELSSFVAALMDGEYIPKELCNEEELEPVILYALKLLYNTPLNAISKFTIRRRK